MWEVFQGKKKAFVWGKLSTLGELTLFITTLFCLWTFSWRKQECWRSAREDTEDFYSVTVFKSVIDVWILIPVFLLLWFLILFTINSYSTLLLQWIQPILNLNINSITGIFYVVSNISGRFRVTLWHNKEFLSRADQRARQHSTVTRCDLFCSNGTLGTSCLLEQVRGFWSQYLYVVAV